jgi:hypothetical protein
MGRHPNMQAKTAQSFTCPGRQTLPPSKHQVATQHSVKPQPHIIGPQPNINLEPPPRHTRTTSRPPPRIPQHPQRRDKLALATHRQAPRLQSDATKEGMTKPLPSPALSKTNSGNRSDREMVGAPPSLLWWKPLIASKCLAATEEMVSRMDGMLREGRSSWCWTSVCVLDLFH